ncbi:hypothetical protein JCM6882_001060 [Rhodosporidiobolus microsporus]
MSNNPDAQLPPAHGAQHLMPVIFEETGAARKNAPKDAVFPSLDELLAHADDLKGKVLVITGAAQGLGLAAAKLAAGRGAKVVLSDINEEKLKEAEEAVKKAAGEGGAVSSKKADVASWKEQVALFRHALDTFGAISFVIANAGCIDGEPLLSEDLDADGEPKEPALGPYDVNVRGATYTAKLAFYHLRRNPLKGRKSLVLVGSIASLFGLPTQPLYAASKHAVHGLAKVLHYEGESSGITVNSVLPWITPTPIFGQYAEALQLVKQGQVDDVAAAMIAGLTCPQSGVTFVTDHEGVIVLPLKSKAYLTAAEAE